LLIRSCRYGWTASTLALLKAGAKPFLPNVDLHLLDDPDFPDEGWDYPLTAAIENGHLDDALAVRRALPEKLPADMPEGAKQAAAFAYARAHRTINDEALKRRLLDTYEWVARYNMNVLMPIEPKNTGNPLESRLLCKPS
jgi:hypothetical protein